MPVKLLHVADVHLDAPFRWLGSRGAEQRRQLKETFRAIVDLALREEIDCLLVAGDLFDSNAPAQDTVDLVQSQLARLPMPVALLPGTHDCLDAGSIYRRLAFGGAQNVRVFDEAQSSFQLRRDLTVHGHANLGKTSDQSPLRGLTPNPDTRFDVALAHGSLAMPGAERDFPIASREIAASGMAYVALGHWHAQRDCSAGGTTAFYSGPPELLAEGELGCALLVELADTGTSVTPRAIARRRCQSLSIAVDELTDLEQLVERVRRLRDSDLILSVGLAGLRAADMVIDVERLARELAEGFFALRIVDRSHPSLSTGEAEALSEKTVIGQFARRMSALVAEAASPEQKATREAALQIGLALLHGRRVLE